MEHSSSKGWRERVSLFEENVGSENVKGFGHTCQPSSSNGVQFYS